VASITSIDADEFIEIVQPLLAAQDVNALYTTLRSHWSADQILSLLASPNADARKVAAFALGLVGTKCCVPKIAEQLKHEDVIVNQMAEHALWSIWFRCGSKEANNQLGRGAQALGRRDFDHAIEHFSNAVEIDPTFAEGYNQRAIVHYLQERYHDSIKDCKACIQLMPCHFGAWSGQGHCHAHLGQIRHAIASYEHALQINPHLDCLREAVGEMRKALKDC
jgi:tetratricopeptide (TPR) repeat protein